MADKDFVLTLAKVMIAAAWADGDLEQGEINALKDLIFRLPEVGGDDWLHLQRYLERPVEPPEAHRMIAELQARVSSEEERLLARQALSELMQADGVFEAEEREMLEEVQKALSAGSGLFGGLSKLLGRWIGRRREVVAEGPDPEDYLRNVIYHDVVARMGEENQLDLPPEQSRKLCLAAGLMAQVAHADLDVSETEKQAISRALREHWGLNEGQAELVAEISCQKATAGIDLARLSRGFYESTEREEREAFIVTLFAVANSANLTANEEIDRIRQISNYLRVPHQRYLEAKLTIPRDDRRGL